MAVSEQRDGEGAGDSGAAEAPQPVVAKPLEVSCWEANWGRQEENNVRFSPAGYSCRHCGGQALRGELLEISKSPWLFPSIWFSY